MAAQYNRWLLRYGGAGMKKPRTSKVLYRGRQWAVTTYGIERLDQQYIIPKKNIKTVHAPYNWDWRRHMSQKDGVNVDDFLDVLQKSLKIHFDEDVAMEDLP